MLKPLSPKTLEKKYAELGLPEEKLKLLHTYFLCFSNLYGLLTVQEAWAIFREYEGVGTVRKHHFVDFAGIVQREAGHPYSVYDMKEVYPEEENDPTLRLIVNNHLVTQGYYRFGDLYTLESLRDKPYYMPTEREELLSYAEDPFFRTPAGKDMKIFIENLKTSGVRTCRFINGDPALKDVEGRPVAGKKLSDIVLLSEDEQWDVDYAVNEAKRQKLLESFSVPASEKILNRIRMNLLVGNRLAGINPAMDIQSITTMLENDFGVGMTMAKVEKFCSLYSRLNNSSHLWQNSGWTPDDLHAITPPHDGPCRVSLGPSFQERFASGELDRAELEKRLAEMGLEIVK